MLGKFVESETISQLIKQAHQHDSWLQFDPQSFSANYNKRPFILTHRLAEHPKFTLNSLFDLCRRLPPDQVRVRLGQIPDDAEFDSSLKKYNQGLTIENAIEHLEDKQAYIAIYNPERDSEYKGAIEELLGEIAAYTEPMEPGLNWYSTYIFISAQGSVTPYHMDREMNFLLQILGRKTAQLWDPMDEAIMTSAQRDRLLFDLGELRPTYKPDFQDKAMNFELQPGLGVHHPFIAPHLVRTGPELSISLAITFRTLQSDIWTDAHCMNQRLRQLGWKPSPVRQSVITDKLKAGVLRFIRRIKGLSVSIIPSRNQSATE